MEQTSVYGVVHDKKKRTRKSQRSNFLTVMSYVAVYGFSFGVLRKLYIE